MIVVAELIQPGHSEIATIRLHGREAATDPALRLELQELSEAARANPSADLYVRIAECHRKLRNYSEAVRCLRRAEKIGFDEDDGE